VATFLILSQVYVPDPASVGQHMAGAAGELARRGHRVVVFTANRGYEDPSVVYRSREVIDGVEVHRLPLSSFGKQSISIRILGAMLFTLQAIVRAILIRKVDCVLVSTSPPMASIAALVISTLRGARVKYWVMDLNPDQMIALNIVTRRSLTARVFDWLNRLILARATDVVVLDRFMSARVSEKLEVRDKLTILPPWPLEDAREIVRHEHNPFRKRHRLEEKFVIMYSGNHSPSNPLTTVIEAAKRLRDEPNLVFLFVGGGAGRKEVEAAESPNIRLLPYQPLAELKYSLAAADVHLVSVGDAMVGIVHPCKVYGAMAAARPIVSLGPQQCHLKDIIEQADIGWHIPHGDIDNAERVLRTILATEPSELTAKGARARALIAERLSKAALCGQLCDILERGEEVAAGASTAGALAAATSRAFSPARR
jgi:colanic acid biosynthesis glycosyl transferase WcaI